LRGAQQNPVGALFGDDQRSFFDAEALAELGRHYKRSAFSNPGNFHNV
jgi:hypothetical protein